jgi:acetolactate synthase I/II/III large subunit
MNVAAIFVNRLESLGVTRVYGLIGTSILDFVDALKDSKIRYISTRQDQAAVSMAVAEGKILSKPGVAAVHGGPGFLNSLTAVAVSNKDCIPAVVITGAVKRRVRGLDSWLEVDQGAIAKPLVKSFFRIDRPANTPSLIERAFSVSSSVPRGPVIVECAEDVWHLDVPNFDGHSAPTNAQREFPPLVKDSEVSQVLELLKNSKAPIIVAGGGINNERGAKLIDLLARKFRVPVVTTGNGRGVLSEESEFSLGRTGFGGGSTLADFCLRDSDFVLAIGAGLSDVSTYAYNYIPHGEIVRVNLDPLAEKKPIPYSITLNCDAISFLEKLLDLSNVIKYELPETWVKKIQQERSYWNTLLDEAISRRYDGFLNPSRFFRAIDGELPEDTIITAGQGLHILYAHSFLKVRNHSSFLAATNLGAMGYAFPAALGAKAVYEEREVLAVLGDGELMMNISDLETAKRENLGVKIIIVNDNSYRVLLMRQKLQKMGRIFGTLLGNPDFEKLGDAFGIPSMSIADDKKIEEAVEFVLEKSDTPRILELKISPDDLPPLNVEASLRF